MGGAGSGTDPDGGSTAAGQPAPRIGAVLLVGGRARRMGGVAKPLLTLGGVSLLARTCVALVDAGAAPIVAVGPRLGAVEQDQGGQDPGVPDPGAADPGGPVVARDTCASDPEVPDLIWVREDPPFGGPVAAIAAALPRAELAAVDWVLLLAGDLVRPEAVVRGLLAALAEGGAGDAAGKAPEPPGLGSLADAGDPQSYADGIAFLADGHPQWLAGIYRADRVRAALAAMEAPEGASCRALLGGLAIRWLPDQDGITADIDTPADLDRARAELSTRVDPEEPA